MAREGYADALVENDPQQTLAGLFCGGAQYSPDRYDALC
jgi:hypothetical protein